MVVVITPQTQEFSRRLKTESGGRFAILTDLDCGYALDPGPAIRINDEKRQAMTAAGWDIAEFHANDNWILPIPATFVLDPTGRIVGRLVDPDYGHRMDIDEMLQAVRRAAAAAVTPAG